MRQQACEWSLFMNPYSIKVDHAPVVDQVEEVPAAVLDH